MTAANTTPTRSRPVLIGAIGVASISTAAAYVAMTGFGRDVLNMSSIDAYAFAGVFELSLVTVALMAREAAQQNRPAQVLLSLTWVLSAASGTFAAAHELYLGHGPIAAVFRFSVPLLAALMWHLALIGDRHLAMERSWSELRTGARMHSMLLADAAWKRAEAANDGSYRARRRLARANARRLHAESVALRTVEPGQMDRRILEWSDALAAVRRGRVAAADFASDKADVTAVTDRVTGSAIDVTGGTGDTATVTPTQGDNRHGDIGSDTAGVTSARGDIAQGDIAQGDIGGDMGATDAVVTGVVTSRPRAVTSAGGDTDGDIARGDIGVSAEVTPEQLSAALAKTRSVARELSAGEGGPTTTLAEAKAYEEIARSIAETCQDVREWAAGLPERWAGTDWSTGELDAAVIAAAEACLALGNAEDLVETTSRIRSAAEEALSLGEVIAQAGAHGRVTGFTGETRSDIGGDTSRGDIAGVTTTRGDIGRGDIAPEPRVTSGRVTAGVTSRGDTGDIAPAGRRASDTGSDIGSDKSGKRPAAASATREGVATARVTPLAADERAAKAAALHAKGWTQQQIADELGVSKRTIIRDLQR